MIICNDDVWNPCVPRPSLGARRLLHRLLLAVQRRPYQGVCIGEETNYGEDIFKTPVGRSPTFCLLRVTALRLIDRF